MEIILYLLAAFGLSALIQSVLCFKVKNKMTRHMTLAVAAAAFIMAFSALNREPGFFPGFNGLIAMFYGAIGVCIILGYGAGWGIYGGHKLYTKRKKTMKITQYVIAYRADHEKIKCLLPAEFSSLRPVLRINLEEIQQGPASYTRIEFNTPVEGRGKRGWLNLKTWENRENTSSEATYADIKSEVDGLNTKVTAELKDVTFGTLEIEYLRKGIEGGCPKENDNDGTFYFDKSSGDYLFRPAEIITEKKEYCDCSFRWDFEIPSIEVLGAYVVKFDRK